MLFREPTLTELIATYTNLLRNSRLFLKDTHQIEVVFQLTDFANNHKIEVRNGQLKQASQLRIRKGVAAISVTYHGTQLKTYHGFDITDQRFKPKYFVGWVGNQKMTKDHFINHLDDELKHIVQPTANCVIFPGLFV